MDPVVPELLGLDRVSMEILEFIGVSRRLQGVSGGSGVREVQGWELVTGRWRGRCVSSCPSPGGMRCDGVS